MKLVSHMAFTLGIGALFGVNPEWCAIMGVGGVFPDLMDSIIAGKSREVWGDIHRTFTHWPIAFPFILVVLAIIKPDLPLFLYKTVYFFIIGVLIHISCDFLTPSGIPFYPPFRKGSRISLGLIKTGSATDYLFGFLPLTLFFVKQAAKGIII